MLENNTFNIQINSKIKFKIDGKEKETFRTVCEFIFYSEDIAIQNDLVTNDIDSIMTIMDLKLENSILNLYEKEDNKIKLLMHCCKDLNFYKDHDKLFDYEFRIYISDNNKFGEIKTILTDPENLKSLFNDFTDKVNIPKLNHELKNVIVYSRDDQIVETNITDIEVSFEIKSDLQYERPSIMYYGGKPFIFTKKSFPLQLVEDEKSKAIKRKIMAEKVKALYPLTFKEEYYQ